MNLITLLPQLLKLLGHGQTLKLLLHLVFSLMDKHKDGMPLDELARDVASGALSILDKAELKGKLGRLVYLAKVLDWAIAEAKSLLPNRPPNLKAFPTA
jgi:hypothetical protein